VRSRKERSAEQCQSRERESSGGAAGSILVSPWDNGYIESFNGKLRGELLDREIFTTLDEARMLIEQWRKECNQIRPHSVRNYRPPAPEAITTIATT
jgi:hypothetical protein